MLAPYRKPLSSEIVARCTRGLENMFTRRITVHWAHGRHPVPQDCLTLGALVRRMHEMGAVARIEGGTIDEAAAAFDQYEWRRWPPIHELDATEPFSWTAEVRGPVARTVRVAAAIYRSLRKPD